MVRSLEELGGRNSLTYFGIMSFCGFHFQTENGKADLQGIDLGPEAPLHPTIQLMYPTL